MYIGGLDVGSSGTKLTVYDSNGSFIESNYEPYDSYHSGSEHTIDFETIIAAVGRVITETRHKPETLGVATFGESFVLVDGEGKILNKSMFYNDARGSAECLTFDRTRTAEVTGTAPAPLYTLPKLKWLVDNRRDLFEKARMILMIPDFIIWSLCGERVINYSAATRSMGFDIRRKCWDESLFKEIGVDISLMSRPVPDGTVAGISNKFGLVSCKIITAMHDQNAAALGAGALTPGDCVDGSGSVECLTPVIASLPSDTSACEAGAAFLPYLDGMYVGCAFSYTGGTALKWFRDELGGGESYRELDSKIGDKPGELLLMPHFAGAATPYMDSDSRALLYGLTLGTTKYELYRAVMEGVAYEMNVNLELLKSCGIAPTRLLATGGGAKSRVWCQIKSDITGLPITIVDAPEVGACGVIMLCARTLGLVSSLEEAKSRFVKEGETLTPDPKKHEIYAKMFEKYKKMYALAKELR